MENTLKISQFNKDPEKVLKRQRTLLQKLMLYVSIPAGILIFGMTALVAFKVLITEIIVINPYKSEIQLSVDNGDTKTIKPGEYKKLTLFSKEHSYKVTGAVVSENKIHAQKSLEQNLKSSKTIIFNPGMGGVIYLRDGDNTSALFGEVIEINQSLNSLFGNDVENIFQDETDASVTLGTAPGYLDLLKVNNRYNGADPELLNEYFKTINQRKNSFATDNYAYAYAQIISDPTAVEEFANTLIDQETPSVEQYLAYQKLIKYSADSQRQAKLLKMFTELAKDHQDNVNYQYLLAELEYSLGMGTKKLEAVVSQEPSHYYANATLSTNAYNLGDFTTAQDYFDKLEQSSVNDDAYSQIQEILLLAQGDYVKLENYKDQTRCVDENSSSCLQYTIYLDGLSGKGIKAKEKIESAYAKSYITKAEYLQELTNLAYYTNSVKEIPEEAIDQESEYFNAEAAFTYYFTTGDYIKAEEIRYAHYADLYYQHVLPLAIYFQRTGLTDRAQAEIQAMADHHKASEFGKTLQKIANGEKVTLFELTDNAYSIPTKAVLARYIYERDNSETEMKEYSDKMMFLGSSTEMMLKSLKRAIPDIKG